MAVSMAIGAAVHAVDGGGAVHRDLDHLRVVGGLGGTVLAGAHLGVFLVAEGEGGSVCVGTRMRGVRGDV